MEDSFDGRSRTDVHHLILRKDNEKSSAEEGIADIAYASAEDDNQREVYFVRERHDGLDAFLPKGDDKSVLELARLPTCAVFHRLTAGNGKGIPHSFAGFIRQWPALPRVVVSISLRVPALQPMIFNNPDIPLRERHVDSSYSNRGSLRSQEVASGQGCVTSAHMITLILR